MVTTASLLANAEDALQNSDGFGVLRYAGEALRHTPEDPRCRLLVARGLRLAGYPDEAAQVLLAASDWMASRGYLLWAVAAVREVLDTHPEDADAAERLAGLHDRFESAQAVFTAPAPPPPIPVDVAPDAADSLLLAADDEAVVRTVKLALGSEGHGELPEVAPTAPLFAELTCGAFVTLLGRIHLRHAVAGDALVEEGAPGHSMFIIVRGAVQVARNGIALAKLGAGALFGEMALVTEQPRTASVTAVGALEYFELDVQDVEQVAAAHPSITEAVVTFARRRMLTNLIATSPLFRLLSAEDRRGVLDQFRPDIYQAGAVVIAEGGHPDALHLVATGTLDVTKKDAEGDVRAIAAVGPGEVLGEIALIRECFATATVIARTKCVLLTLRRSAFSGLLDRYPALEAYLDGVAAARESATAAVLKVDGPTLDADQLVMV